MQPKRILFLLLPLFFIIHCSAYAKSPVWKISKDGNHLFLGGTIHILTKADYPLPEPFEAAYKNSELLVLEVDFQEIQSPSFQQNILKNTMYKDGTTITDFLQPSTLQALQSHLAGKGIPPETLLKFKPGMLSITLTMVELQSLGMVGTGVDEFFNLRALNDSRPIKHLETAAEQIEFISNMGVGNENEFIEYTLDEISNLRQVFGTMKSAWRSGDNQELKKVALAPLKNRFPKIYNSILVDRNKNWVPQIEAMINTKEVEFILFGALHLVGEKGILNQLSELGYRVENL